MKERWLGGCLRDEIRRLGIALADGLCDFEGCAYANGVVVVAEGLDMLKLGAVATG
jgi:hypothetical protein